MSEENSFLNDVDIMHLRDAHRAWLRSLEYINNINSEKAFIAGAEFMISEKLASYKWEQAYHDEAIDHATTAINMQKFIQSLEAENEELKKKLSCSNEMAKMINAKNDHISDLQKKLETAVGIIKKYRGVSFIHNNEILWDEHKLWLDYKSCDEVDHFLANIQNKEK